MKDKVFKHILHVVSDVVLWSLLVLGIFYHESWAEYIATAIAWLYTILIFFAARFIMMVRNGEDGPDDMYKFVGLVREDRANRHPFWTGYGIVTSAAEAALMVSVGWVVGYAYAIALVFYYGQLHADTNRRI